MVWSQWHLDNYLLLCTGQEKKTLTWDLATTIIIHTQKITAQGPEKRRQTTKYSAKKYNAHWGNPKATRKMKNSYMEYYVIE